jgi:cytochrome d ubiquinol oxidase subunit I
VIEIKLMLKAIRKGPDDILPSLQADIRPVSPVVAAPGQA